MEIELSFGGKNIGFDTNDYCPPSSYAGRYGCKFPAPLSFEEIKDKILKELSQFKDKFDNSNILTIVNDSYRRTPNGELLSIVWDFVKDGDFIIASGTHRQPNDADLRQIFGNILDKVKPKLYFHDCYDQSSLVDIGRTESGTPVLINMKIIEADLIFAINSIEPHFFAGFTGGRKSIVPGLAGFDTAATNHRLAKHEKAEVLNLETNPLHQDLEECIKLIGDKHIYAIQCITNRESRIVDVFCGQLHDAFNQACACASKYYTVEIPEKYDIVIANCEPPLDINLYQLQKAQEHGGRMVADGGVLIVVGACKEGVGSEYFMNLAEKYPTPEIALDKGITDDSFGIHKLIKTARQLKKNKIYYVTTLDEDVVKRVYFKSFSDIKEALKSALNEIGRNVKIAVLDDAGYTVPVIKP
ncbi:MAG: nickel-dependent lactate racemase [candidate division Zixibacteria bacterium]|nr:nickel-dependent lactate racemase [candidate division Zixibacteria bacterium]